LNRYELSNSFWGRLALNWKRRYFERFASHYEIYLYHRIHPSAAKKNTLKLKVTPETFERQVLWLKQHRNLLPLRELVAKHGKLQPNDTAITFDDGYVDNYEHAFPIIKKHRIPVTIFLSTFWIGNYQRMLCDQIDLCVKHDSIDEDKFEATAWRIRHLMPEERMSLLVHQYRYNPEWEKQKTDDKHGMTWSMIKEMQASGLVHFEVHGHHHLSCRHLSLEQFEHEALKCKEMLEEQLGVSPELFAYPFGSPEDLHELCPQWIQQLGFKAAFLATGKSNHNLHSPFLLDRTQQIPSF